LAIYEKLNRPYLATLLVCLSFSASVQAMQDQVLNPDDDLALQYHPSQSPENPAQSLSPGITLSVTKNQSSTSGKYIDGDKFMLCPGLELVWSRSSLSWYAGYTTGQTNSEKNSTTSTIGFSQFRAGIGTEFSLNPFSLEPLAALTFTRAYGRVQDQFVSLSDSDSSVGLFIGAGIKKHRLFSVQTLSATLRQSFTLQNIRFSKLGYRHGSLSSETTLGISYEI